MKSFIRPSLYLAGLAAVTLGCELISLVPETEEKPTLAQVTNYVVRPGLVPASEANVQRLKVPAGFRVTKFAEGLGKPRMLTVGGAGQVYVTDREAGTVTLLRDANGDGTADEKEIVANIKDVHGLTIHDGKLYLVAIRELYAADINEDGTLRQLRQIINDLPDAGQHPNRTIDFGPDNLLYITVGSTCNACQEDNPENATILQVNPDGTNRKIYATGLRNTIGFGWHPETYQLWGLDHGIDWLGNNEQEEEVNQIVPNADYGWPYIYGAGNYYPGAYVPPGGVTFAQYRQKTTLPVLGYTAHSAPLGMVFYTGSNFPAQYQNDAFVTMRGSWNRSVPSGYKIVRLHFENGRPTRFEDFLTGFLVNNNLSQFGRPVGITVHTDGSLLFSDDNNGVIYRIAYSR